MKRRLALTAGALVAALSFSSCSTFDHSDVAATVDGHELTRDQLDTLVGADSTAESTRAAISAWIRLVVIEGNGYASVPTSSADLQQRVAATAYATPAESGLACVSAIVTADEATATAAAQAIAGGMSFNDAFLTYNQSQQLISSGGVILDPDTGLDCAALQGFDPYIDSIASLQPGEISDVVALPTSFIIFGLRPWEEVSPESQSLFLVAAEPADTAGVDISIASRFGTWNPATLAVEPSSSE